MMISSGDEQDINLSRAAGANNCVRKPLSVAELDQLVGKRDHRKFLNTRNELYRARKMGQNPPSRDEALKLMAAEPNLIRRPVVLRGSDIVLGYDEEGLKRISK